MGELETFHVDPSNQEQSRAWDGDEGAYWAAHAEHFDTSVAEYHRRLMDSAAIEPDWQVLDIGCGTGQTTRDAARLASSGHALGLDLSSKMLDVARRLSEREGVRNATFEQVDAQVAPFETGSFDVAISRTGAMFFGDPVAAFTNIGRALRPGRRLTMVAWQPVSENEWFRAIGTAMAAGRDLPFPPPEAPGPFALSDTVSRPPSADHRRFHRTGVRRSPGTDAFRPNRTGCTPVHRRPDRLDARRARRRGPAPGPRRSLRQPDGTRVVGGRGVRVGHVADHGDANALTPVPHRRSPATQLGSAGNRAFL